MSVVHSLRKGGEFLILEVKKNLKVVPEKKLTRPSQIKTLKQGQNMLHLFLAIQLVK